MNDIAIAHNHYPAQGGGERVANHIAELFDAPIVTAWIDEGEPSADVPVHELIDGIPHDDFVRERIMPNPALRNYLYSWLWELTPPLRDKDIIIQSGGFPSYYVPEDHQTIIKYIHSPPRYPFDRFGPTTDPITDSVWRRPLKVAGQLWNRWQKGLSRRWNRRRMGKGGIWVANSECVKHRIHLYYGVPKDDIRVIYPPVPVNQYDPIESDGGYYLALSRLEPAKRIGVLIDAFRDRDEKLIIAGDGNKREELENKADDAENIEFRGYVSESDKRDLFHHARATLFSSAAEDFGMVPIESLAAGTPVIGVNEGFTSEQLHDGKNGRLVDECSPAAFDAAVDGFDPDALDWNALQCHHYAHQFSADRFDEEMRAVVAEARELGDRSADLRHPTTMEEQI